MQTIISILGVVSWVLLAILSAALAYSACCHFSARLVEKIQREARDATRLDIANDILMTAWWFSESHEANLALSVYGKSLMKTQRCCSSTMREEWRKEIFKLTCQDKA